MICPKCNSDNVNDAVFCANCGTVLTNTPDTALQQNVPPVGQPPYGSMPPVYQPPYGSMPPVPDSKDKLALIGMILGIASLPCCFISLYAPVIYAYIVLGLCALVGIAGIILSAMGFKSRNRKGMAIAGLVCAIVGTVLISACIGLLALGTYAINSGLYDDYLFKFSRIIFK